MTDSQADAPPLADPGPPPPAPASLPSRGDRFFGWLRGIGIVRGDGWIGGVCAGIAARIGVDPLIVRGVFVVAALFGLPMFLVYAIGWALLPDLAGRIHLQELTRRRFDPAMVGIGLMLLVGLFPVAPWFFTAVLPFGVWGPVGWGELTPFGVLGTFVAVAIIGGIIFLIARTSSRASTTGTPDPRTASADPQAPGSPAPDDSGVVRPADPAAGDSAPAGSLPPAPAPERPVTKDDTAIAAWRAQHDAWRVQDDAWRRQQQDAERAARDRARAERAAAGAAFAAEAAERKRLRILTRPRTSAAFVSLTLGLALVVGAVSAFGFGGDDAALAVAVGLFAAALVTAIAMVVAGSIRRRSGFLAFVTVTVLFAGSLTAAFPISHGIVYGSAWVNNYQPQSFTQLGGSLTIDLTDVGGRPDPIDIEMRGPSTTVNIYPGVLLELEVTGADEVEWVVLDPDDGTVSDQGTWATRGGSIRQSIDTRSPGDTGTRQFVTLDQTDGTPYVAIFENPED